MNDFEKIMWYLLEETETQITFSTIIPTSNSNHLNSKIEEINILIETMISNARAGNHYNQDCLFTYNNNSVKYHNKSLPDGVKLTELGQKIMWRRLNDGLRKTLRIFRHQLSNKSSVADEHIRNSNLYD